MIVKTMWGEPERTVRTCNSKNHKIGQLVGIIEWIAIIMNDDYSSR